MEEVRKIIVQFDDGKTMTTYLGPDNRIGDSYWVNFCWGMKKYFCLVDRNGKPITPLLTQMLISYICSQDRNNILLELKKPKEKNSNFYHFQKRNGEYQCVFSTNNKENIPFKMKQTEDDDYLFLVSPNNKLALYSFQEARQITSFFDKLELIEEDWHHLAFFTQNIIIEHPNVHHFLATQLVGFIGYHGEFSSQIYDTSPLIYRKEDGRYYVILERGEVGMKRFQDLCFNLTLAYQDYYQEMDIQNTKVISNLFMEKVEALDIPNYKKPAKIIEFPKR